MFKEPRSVQVIVYRETPAGREYLMLLKAIGTERFWQPVSGSHEPGERDDETARREVAEETGFRRLERLRDVGLVSRFEIAPAWRARFAPGVTRNTQVTFAARVGSGVVALDTREHTDFRWLSYADARALLRYEPNRRALDLVNEDNTGPRRAFELSLPRRQLVLGGRTFVMGILNATPDSFSDGGAHSDVASALDRALRMQEEGADIVDVGGESSRPGAGPVSPEEEQRRVIPVVRALAGTLSIPISIDTTRASTARAALDEGAEIVNDVSALRFDAELASVAVNAGAALILMHMRGEPRTMQALPPSADILGEVERDLLDALCEAQAGGVAFERLLVDPGIGFGKTVAQNSSLLANLERFASLDRPILVGASRKGFLGTLTGRAVDERIHASVASVTAAILAGAHVVRVHDVAASVDAARVADAVLRERAVATADD